MFPIAMLIVKMVPNTEVIMDWHSSLPYCWLKDWEDPVNVENLHPCLVFFLVFVFVFFSTENRDFSNNSIIPEQNVSVITTLMLASHI